MKSALALLALGSLGLSTAEAHAETLDYAIARALAGDPSLASLRSEVDAAAAARASAFAQFFPIITAGADRGSTYSNASVFDPVTGTFKVGGTETGDVSISLSQTVFSSGRLFNGYLAARSDEERAEQTYRSEEDQVILLVVQAYAGVLYGQQAVQIEQDDVDRLSKEVDAANVRFDAGAATKTDVYQAETALAAARSALAAAQADLASQRATYYRRVGEMPGTLERPPEPATPPDLDTAIAAGRNYAPDIAAAAAALKAAKDRTRSSYADYFPTLSLSGSAERSGDTGLDNLHNETAAATLHLSVPIWAGGRTTAEVRAAKANERGAKYSLDDAYRANEESVTQAWSRLDAAKLQVDAGNAGLEAATFARRGAELERREGLRTQLDLLDQIANENTARLALASAQRDVLTTAYQLLEAAGEMPRPELPKSNR